MDGSRRRLRNLRVGQLLPALGAAAIAVGCGGGDDDDATTAATTTGGGGGGGGAETVELTEYEFTPNDLKVSQGDTITADNGGDIEHNLTIEQGTDAETASKELQGTPDIQSGDSANLDVTVKPGRYSIVCTIAGHRELGMIGTISVR